MATPIPTDKYEDNSKYAPSLLFFLPLVLTLWSNVGSTIAEVSQQSNEDKLNNILKRIGYRPIVEVYRRFILMIYDLLYLIPISALVFYFILPTVSVYIALLIMVIIVVEMWLIDMITKHTFSGGWGKVAKYIYHGIGFFLSL